MVMQGYTPASFAPMQATYQNWLQSQLGSAPLAQAYGQSFSPYAELAYLSNPVSGAFNTANPWRPADAINPYQSFLGSGATSYQNLGSQDWAQRARDVQSTLDMPSGPGDPALSEGQLRVQERFGTGDQAVDRQRQLGQAAIVSQSPFALRGETQNILNRLYNQWMVNAQPTAAGEDPTGYLQHAMNNLWGRFGVV